MIVGKTKGKKLARMLTLLAAGMLSLPAGAISSAEQSALQQIIPLYSAPPANSLVAEQYRFNLISGTYGNQDDFTGRARLAFTAEKRPMFESKPFSLQVPTQELIHGGWRSEKQSFWWHGAGEVSLPHFAVPLKIAQGDDPFRLAYYDEIWIDYSIVPTVALCVPQVEMRLAVQPTGRSSGKGHDLLARTGALSASQVLSNIDAGKASWKQKDYDYLVRRELGLAPDDDWRYTQADRHAVLQRRMHKLLDSVEALDIWVAPGINVEQVNLRISRTDSHRGGDLVEFAGLLSSPSLPDGRPGVRLNLRDALEKHFAKEWAVNSKEPGELHFYLQEIQIFVPGGAHAIAHSNPVRNLEFVGVDTGRRAENGRPALVTNLPSTIVTIGGTRRRVVGDLRQLAQRGDIDLKEALLELHPSPGATSCAIRIEGVHVVSAYAGNVPVFANRVDSWSRRWGDVLRVVAPQRGYVESPGLIGHLFFAALTMPDVRESNSIEYNIKLGANDQSQIQLIPQQTHALRYRILGPDRKEVVADRTRLLSSRGATIVAEGGLPRATPAGNLLMLEGRSKALDIAWPLTARINDKTWFALSVEEGVEHLGVVSLSLELSDGSIVERKIVPNQPMRLGITDAEVRNVRLHILPVVIPYRFKLGEMVFFEPKAATYAEAFSIPLPTPFAVKPKVVLSLAVAPLLEMQPGRVAGLSAGLTESEPLRFSTLMEPPLDSVRGLRLKYRLPPAYLDGEACPLTLQFNWANGKTERELCFEKSEDDLFIPIANWLGTEAKPRNYGALHSIDWILRPDAGTGRLPIEAFDLKFEVEGWTMFSAADQFRLFPIFNAGHTPIFADDERIKKISAEPYAPKVWLPLDAQAVSRIVATGGQIQPVENSLVTLDQVVLEPKRPLTEQQWHELSALPIPSSPPRWRTWLTWATVVLVPLIAWWKGWWSPSKVWRFGKARGNFALRMLSWIGGYAMRWISRWLPNLNVAIGLLALGPGLWTAGRLGWSFAGMMLLVGAGLVVWGAYLHWRKGTGGDARYGMASIRSNLVILGLTIGCAVWSLGQYKLSPEALWGFLPLIGAIYASIPALHRWVRQLWTNHPRFIWLGLWLLITIVLYLMGLRARAASGENYFFTFGGLTAVLAWRAGMLVIEPHLRRLFPAISERIYGGAGSLYFAGALVILVATTAMLGLNFEPIAQQLAIVVYYCLAIGIGKEAWVRRKAGTLTSEEPHAARAETSAGQ